MSAARRLAYSAAAGVLRSGARARLGVGLVLTGWRVRLGKNASLRAALYEQKCCTEVYNDLILLRHMQKKAKNSSVLAPYRR